MRYISTRGEAPALSFEDVVLTGMAADGGLYVPETIPTFSQAELEALVRLLESKASAEEQGLGQQAALVVTLRQAILACDWARAASWASLT